MACPTSLLHGIVKSSCWDAELQADHLSTTFLACCRRSRNVGLGGGCIRVTAVARLDIVSSISPAEMQSLGQGSDRAR